MWYLWIFKGKNNWNNLPIDLMVKNLLIWSLLVRLVQPTHPSPFHVGRHPVKSVVSCRVTRTHTEILMLLITQILVYWSAKTAFGTTIFKSQIYQKNKQNLSCRNFYSWYIFVNWINFSHSYEHASFKSEMPQNLASATKILIRLCLRPQRCYFIRKNMMTF